MTSITLKNVRCFVEPKPAPIAPLTLLVGENSTGKSTFLAMTRVLADTTGRFRPPDFNEEPFHLGSFRDIANYRGARWRASTFEIGLSVPLPESFAKELGSGATHVSFVAAFSAGETEPVLTKWRLSIRGMGLTLHRDAAGKLIAVDVEIPGREVSLSDADIESFPWAHGEDPLFFIRVFASFVNAPREVMPPRLGEQLRRNEIIPLMKAAETLSDYFPSRPYATAPVRSKPKRTYDPLSTEPDPEGSHVAMVLAKLLGDNTKASKRLQGALREFGVESGLFRAIQVKKLGRESNAPFQIKLNFGAQPTFNLVDVGYGVSQALPIAVDVIRSPRRSTLLIQQPEVHLHPRAQAALGSLLVNMAKAQQKRFLVETHSDYLVDRVRMEIRENEHLTPADVQILYFQREDDGRVEIYPLDLDEQGNIVNAPPGYREFFLREEERFLGV